MARLFVTDINLNKNELQNARIQGLTNAPSAPVNGQIYFNTTDSVMYYYNGLSSPNGPWMPMSGSTEVIQDVIGLSIVGGVGLTSTYGDPAGTTTIDLDNTAVVAGSYGSTTKIPTFTVDAQGRLTAAGEADLATQLDIGADNAHGGYKLDLLTDSIKFVGGEGIDTDYEQSGDLHIITVSGEDATSSNKGIASFDSTDFTVTSGNVSLNVEKIEDIAGNLISGGTGIDVTYTDGSGNLSIDIDSTVVTKDGSQTLTNKSLGSGTVLSSDLNASTYKITNLGAPTDGTDAATKAYVDAVSEGLHIHEAAKVYIGTPINLETDLEVGDIIDGVTLTAEMRVLVNGQSGQQENGIWVVKATGVPVRALDFDSPLEIKSGDFVFVSSGNTYANTGWVQTNPTVTIGSSPISFTQFSGAGTYTAGAGLTLDGSVFSVDVTPSSGNASIVNSGGAIEVKVNVFDGLEVTSSGIGINNGPGVTFDTSGALTLDAANGYGVRKLAYNLGDGSSLSYVISHGLSTRDVTVHVYENATPYGQVETDVEHTDSNNTTIRFTQAPEADKYRVVIVG